MIALLTCIPRSAIAQDSSDVPSCATTRDPAARLWCRGAEKWEAHDYAGAIPFLSQALDLQRRHPTLSHTAWRILVDNLGMAYGMGGNLKKAKAHRAHVISGESLPDPRADDSFQRFMRDSTFLAALNRLPHE